MSSPESSISIETALKRTSESAGVVFKGLEPMGNAAVDNFILLGYFVSLKHPRLRSIFGAAYRARRQNDMHRGRI